MNTEELCELFLIIGMILGWAITRLNDREEKKLKERVKEKIMEKLKEK